jgi:hypothetical protein
MVIHIFYDHFKKKQSNRSGTRVSMSAINIHSTIFKLKQHGNGHGNGNGCGNGNGHGNGNGN